MKKLKTFTLFIFCAFFINLSCKKDDDSFKEQEEQGEGPNRDEVEVKINLPEGSGLNVGDTYLYTLGTNADVDAQGKVLAPIFDGSTELAFLFNSKNEPLLAGFISKDKKEISINTTAEVLLYYAVPAYIQSSELKDGYLSEINTLSSFSLFSEGLKNLFKTDNLMLQKGSYKSLLQAQLDLFSETDMSSKTSKNISVDSRDERSGLILGENDAKIHISNKYKRAAHTFIYKKSTTNLNGQENVINAAITGDDKANFEFALKAATRPPNAQDRKVDIHGLVLACNVIKFDQSTSEPFDLELFDNESAAKYEVAVIGAGKLRKNREMTTTERQKFEELSKKVFIMDYLLPITLDIIGRKSEFDNNKEGKEEALYSAVLPYLEKNSTVKSLVLENEFQAAIEAFLPVLYDNGGSFGEIFKLMQDVYAVLSNGDPNAYDFIVTDAQKANSTKVLKIIEETMKLVSYQCFDAQLEDVSNIETWEVIVDQGKVKLTPQTAVVSVLATAEKTQEIEATVQIKLETGESIEYEWKTTTKFGGVINDLNGKSGSTFTSSFSKVYFLSNIGASQLSDGDNIEEVSVTAFVNGPNGRTEVGKATMQVFVKKSNFIMTPNNSKISGNTTTNMQIQHLNANITIPDANTDYKIVWTTTGNHGQFESGKTSVTTYNTDKLKYVCTDTDTKTGTEQFTAVIYAKSKNSAGDYKLAGEAGAILNLDNTDPKKMYFSLNDIFYIEKLVDEECIVSSNPIVTIMGARNYLFNSFFVTKIANAKSYTLTVASVKDGDGYEYGGRSWSWNNNSTQYANDGVGTTDQNGDPITLVGDFELYIYGGAVNTCANFYGEYVTRLAATQATGQLTVILE
ncbi:hypothetical protein [Cellulophaga tyrosinoxydans]|uniref:Uncharacterized protein n=1 Tax=Cellulophaga tyrosinoxydans TaxID=504486 RepID=A0A1W1Z0N6_9FLAO|nr:hypothetical protein [Cellulophaga tyrosinoxydans]SMC41651.1 hypothetical protein SAMN05660703_1006 [Cellulophaga tyrosinoxydans]